MTLQISTGEMDMSKHGWPFPREAQLQNGRVQWASSHFEHEEHVDETWAGESPQKTELLMDQLPSGYVKIAIENGHL